MEGNKEEKKVASEEKVEIKNGENNENKAKNMPENQNEEKTELTKSVGETKSTEKNKEVQENETKFKKAETNIKGNTVKKKKHTFLKAILIIIGILVIAYCVFVFRNYFILKDVLVKAGRFENLESYSYEINSKQGDVELNNRRIIKEGIGRMDIENVTIPERSLIAWKDYNSGEKIVAFTGVKQALKSNDESSISIGDSFPFLFTEINEAMPGLVLFCLMYTDEINDKDCYVIQIASDYKIWVEKETGLVVKEENCGEIEELTSLKLQNVEDIYKPDLTGYEVTEQ